MQLTDNECRNARCPEGHAYQRFADSGGLYLEATATGSPPVRRGLIGVTVDAGVPGAIGISY